MTVERFFELFQTYGQVVVFVIIFCEHMNLPGFPAGIIMPSIGILIAQSALSLFSTLVLSVVAGVGGSLVLYGICYWGGEPIMHKLLGRSARFKRFVTRSQEYIERHHGRGLALCRLIPVLRTIVSVPAGLLRIPLRWFVPWSAVGIAVWNTVLIGFGYFGSDALFALLFG